MPTNIGPKIGIEGEAQYRKQINDIITQTKTLSSEMKKLTSEYAKDDKSLEGNRKKREQLTKIIEKQKEALQTQTKMLEESKNVLDENGNRTEELANKTEKWQQVVNNTQTEINKLQNELKTMPTTLDLVGDKFQEVGKQMESIGKGMTKYITAPLSALGVLSVKEASNFTDAMAKVYTIADETVVPMNDMQEAITQLSNEMGIGASDIAEAVYTSISAGQDTADAVNFVENATKLARAGFTDTANATDVLTTVLNAYGMEAEKVGHISDVLIQTQNLGKTTVDELASSMGKVIPTAEMAGVSFENLSAMYASLTKNGIQTRFATTYLNAMLGELSSTGSTVDKALHEMTEHIQEGGLSFKQMMENGFEMTDVLSLLDEYANETGQTMADLFGSDLAGRGAGSLWSHAEEVNEFSDAMMNASNGAGATQTAFEKLQTPSFQLQQLLTEIKNGMIDLGSQILTMLMPAFQSLKTSIENMLAWWKNLDDSTKQTIITIAGIIAVVGPLLVAVGKVVVFIGTLMKSIAVIKTAIAGVGAVMSGAILPILGIIAGITALIGIGVLLYQNWDTIKAKAQELWTSLVTAFQSIKDGVIQKFNEIVEGGRTMISNLANGILAGIGLVTSAMTQIVTGIINTIGNFLTSMIDKGRDLIAKLGEGIMQSASDIVTRVQEIGRNIVDGVWQGISGAVGTFTANVTKFFSGIVDNVKSTLGINSPSKVFAQIGRYMGQGLNIGWEQSMKSFNPSKDISMRVASVDMLAGIGAYGNNYSFNPNITINGDYHERDGMNIALSLDRWLGAQV